MTTRARRRSRGAVLALSWLAGAVALGAGVAFPAGAGETAAARGAEVLAPFKRDLQQALREGLAKGAGDAIDACRVQAPEIASAAAREAGEGVRVGRTSHKLRNPDNAPPEWTKPILAAWQDPDADRAPRTVPLPDGGTGYAEPILTLPLCLGCHGSDLAPGVAARIREQYPQDQATGFAVGDLRGIFWVELPAEPSAAAGETPSP